MVSDKLAKVDTSTEALAENSQLSQPLQSMASSVDIPKSNMGSDATSTSRPNNALPSSNITAGPNQEEGSPSSNVYRAIDAFPNSANKNEGISSKHNI